jgi:hypothetical protein
MVIGGYAVIVHGYVRTTGDLDIWVATTGENADRIVLALKEFGFMKASPELFREPNAVVRMGVRPLRIELLTGISGVEFDECYPRREVMDFDGLPVPVICLEDLKANKRASGRYKDLADLDEL